MNRTLHMQPTLALGLTAQGIGTCFGERIVGWQLLASAQAGDVATS